MTVTSINASAPLHHLYKNMVTTDPPSSEKILDLIEKINARKMMIGFAGHFSAGKSTLINTLLNDQLLPSSPIPTSANIVHLYRGDPQTITYFLNDPPALYVGEVPFEEVKALCRDGESIKRVDISRPLNTLPDHVTLLDTPGVDSTNDADRLITESSLHLMDYMFYVMDYNHVQSEVNLQFLLEMQQRSTPFSVVINQIDKHTESELSFDQFKQSVHDSFKQWGIAPEHIFFASLKDFTSDNNDYERLNNEFRKLYERSYDDIEKQALQSAEKISEESVEFYKGDFEEYQQKYRYQLEQANNLIEQSDWSATPDPNTAVESAREQFDNRVSSLITNAYLMPSSLREDAEAFLESIQPGFKVGRFFTKNRTEQEKLQREQVFYEHIHQVIEKNLIWPLRDRLTTFMEQLEINDPSLISQIQSLSFEYEKEQLYRLNESGASVTGQYVLRYTDQLAKDIKQKMKSFMNDWKQVLIDHLADYYHQLLSDNKEVYDAFSQKEEAEEAISNINHEIQQYNDHLTNLMKQTTASEENKEKVKQDLRNRKSRMEKRQVLSSQSKESSAVIEDRNREEASYLSHEQTVSSVLAQAEKAMGAVKGLDGFDELISQLDKKKERLKNRRFTVALFGAFSAGKSSFANALLGEKLLPASPNPTTATINKISPPTKDHPHRSIEAMIKSEADMLEDLFEIMGSVNIKADSLKDAYDKVILLSNEQWNHLNQKSVSFLKAFTEGYAEISPYIGEVIPIPWHSFAAYVAEERYSCFIESMELFYDCEWTRAGVTLVDTPGADSVNARHTGVSFEYIKNADAVLFVTYYNHPFSKADQSFLTQLGRVKDSFSMDKMFFIINASDLASSNEELQSVEMYVAEQLATFQIRNPRLFSISSKLALEEANPSIPSGLTEFEERFKPFLHEELQSVLMASIQEDIQHLNEAVNQYIQDVKLSEKERVEKRQWLLEKKQQTLEVFEQASPTTSAETIANKVEKQVHYVHQRMMLNFNDYFKHHFNPAMINGREQDIKSQLHEAKDGLFQEINFEMIQELRAVSLRIERLLEDMLSVEKNSLEKKLMKIHSSVKIQMEEWHSLPLPEFIGTFEINNKEAVAILKLFKNTRTFFEKNQKEDMKESFQDLISPVLDNELAKEAGNVQSFYVEQWNRLYQTNLNQWKQKVEEEFKRSLYQLDHPADLENLEIAYDLLINLKKRSNLSARSYNEL